jgi:NitT/TauT family transport system substrate-binding protein
MTWLSRRDLLRSAAWSTSAVLTAAACAPLSWLPSRSTAPSPPATDVASRSDTPRATDEQPAATVRVHVGRIMAEAALYLAIDRDYFHQYGITIELINGTSGAESMQLLAGEQIDVALAGLTVALFNLVQRGVQVKLVVPVDTYYPDASTLFLMVRPELLARGEIRDYGDLAGHRVAVPVRGAFIHYLLGLALRRGGLEVEAVEVVEMPFADANAALASGAISAAIQSEPLATLAAEQGIAVKWRSAGEIRPGLVGAGFFFGPGLLSRRRDVGERWVMAYLRGTREYDALLQRPGGRDEIAAILSRYTAATDTSLYARMTLPTFGANGELDLAMFDEQRRWYVEHASAPASVELRQAVDPSFADQAVQELGRA